MLKVLTEAFGVSGYEAVVRDIIYKEIKDFCTEIKVDSMGNMSVFKKAKGGSNSKKVLLAAHMDEVGLVVTDITEGGYLKFAPIGGMDPKVFISQRVTIGDIKGVIALKAIHLTTAEERKKPVDINQLYIDIGAKDRADAEKYVSKGDYCAFDSKYEEFCGIIKAKALDDRVGCMIMIDMLKKDWDVDLYCNFTAQEEMGIRGAMVASRGIKPDYAIVLEGTTCNDLPKTNETMKVTRRGQGPALSVLDLASKANQELMDMLMATAKKYDIPYQFRASTVGMNDAGAICIADGGVKAASVSVPCRYIHSPVNVMSKKDFEDCERLVEAFLKELGEDN